MNAREYLLEVNGEDEYMEWAIELMEDYHTHRSKEEAEKRYWDAVNWTKIHNMEYPGNLAQSLHIASGRLAAFGKE